MFQDVQLQEVEFPAGIGCMSIPRRYNMQGLP